MTLRLPLGDLRPGTLFLTTLTKRKGIIVEGYRASGDVIAVFYPLSPNSAEVRVRPDLEVTPLT